MRHVTVKESDDVTWVCVINVIALAIGLTIVALLHLALIVAVTYVLYRYDSTNQHYHHHS